MITRNTLRKIAVVIAIALLTTVSRASETTPGAGLVDGETAFGLGLYNQLKSRDGNLFFSPYSISTCLGMTYVGARGKTAQQMAATLHFKSGPQEIAGPMGELEKALNEIRQEKGIELSTANGLWAQRGHPFLPSFIQTAQQDFGASINQVDFLTQYEPIRMEINNWVSEKTKGKIRDLIPPGAVNPSTRLVLANAIYFKGKWKYPFKTNMTKEETFTTASGGMVKAPLMSMKSGFNYAKVPDLQLLELPYGDDGNGALSMVILLPTTIDGIKELEKSLSASALSNWINELHEEEVKAFIPKFKMTIEFGLAGTLQKMGMKDGFTPRADFSGMDGGRDLFISAVVHKAYVDVNEEGTAAAAATGVMVEALAVRQPRPVPTFRADHPFIFLIRDTRSGSILFLGRVSDPTK